MLKILVYSASSSLLKWFSALFDKTFRENWHKKKIFNFWGIIFYILWFSCKSLKSNPLIVFPAKLSSLKLNKTLRVIHVKLILGAWHLMDCDFFNEFNAFILMNRSDMINLCQINQSIGKPTYLHFKLFWYNQMKFEDFRCKTLILRQLCGWFHLFKYQT